MAYGLVGNSAINRASSRPVDYTYIDREVPSPNRGIIREVSIYVENAGTFKIKSFMDDGTNYVFLGEFTTASLSTGLNTISLSIPIEIGGFIGHYSADGRLDAAISGGAYSFQSGDITTTTLKTDWTAGAYISSIQGKVFRQSTILSY